MGNKRTLRKITGAFYSEFRGTYVRCLVEDHFLGFFVEQMDVVDVDSHLDDIAGTSRVAGRNTGGQVNAGAVQVQIGFGTHQLGNFYITVDQADRSGADAH